MTDYILTQLRLAKECRSQGRYNEAIVLYLEIAVLVNGVVNVPAIVADCYYRLAWDSPHGTDDHNQKAVEWMEKAVVQAPADGRLRASLGLFYELCALDYQKAGEEFRRAIKLRPHDIWALVNAAGLYGSPDSDVTLSEAINWVERAIILEPDEPRYHMFLSHLYQEAGRYDEAKLAEMRALVCPRPLT